MLPILNESITWRRKELKTNTITFLQTCSGRCHDLKTCVESMAYHNDGKYDVTTIPQNCNFTLHVVPDLNGMKHSNL